MFKQLRKTLRRNIKLTLSVTDEVVEHVVDLNRDTSYGARPLRRLITEHVETPLADQIIESEQTVKAAHVSIVQDQIQIDLTHNT